MKGSGKLILTGKLGEVMQESARAAVSYLRSRADLLAWTEAAGLRVVGRLDIRPHHRKAQNASDPLHSARAAEVTSLWRLAV